MNCTRCGMPLETNARFCRNCGQPVTIAAPPGATPGAEQPYQSMLDDEQATSPMDPSEAAQFQASQPPQGPLWLRPPAMSQPEVPPQAPTVYYQAGQPVVQPTQQVMPGSMPSGGQNVYPGTLPATGKTRPRRRRGWIPGCLAVLLVLLLALGFAWVAALRPYLHNLAQGQIDQVLTAAVNQMPPTAPLLPPGTVHVQENAINNLIVLNSSPSDPVQHALVHITPAGVRMDFQVYGFPCAITGIPQVNAGQLVMTNVTVEGVIGLIMSPDEMTSVVNSHLADAQLRFRHPILGVQLLNQEMDLLVGTPIP